MLIAGRLVQGLGGGGINSMSQIIVSDLVPVRERPQYMALIFAFFGIGTAIGPPIGGVVARYNWRWVFYLNLPLGGLTLILQLLFLRVSYVRETSLTRRAIQIDWAGNAILSASVVSILVALSWAGKNYPWGSWRVLVPLLVGFAGMGLFHAYEVSPWVADIATIAPRIWINRTSAINILLVFIQSMLMYWATYCKWNIMPRCLFGPQNMKLMPTQSCPCTSSPCCSFRPPAPACSSCRSSSSVSPRPSPRGPS